MNPNWAGRIRCNVIHPAQEKLEQYAANQTPESELAAMEDHLLICEHCQRVIAELDEFKGLIRRGLCEFAESEK